MVPNESNPIKGMRVQKAGTKPVKMTRGEIGQYSRDKWFYMKSHHELQDMQIARMKPAICPAKVNNMTATLVRLFEPDMAKDKGITIMDYESLNEHPELILYEGYQVQGRGGELIIKRRGEGGPSFLEEKIKEGTITEVGVVIPKTAAQKFLKGFGNFLMMGGIILVLILVFVIVLLISIVAKSC